MRSEQPEVSMGGRYSVVQTARALGVSKQTVLNYIYRLVFKPKEVHFTTTGHCGMKIDGSAILRVWAAERKIKCFTKKQRKEKSYEGNHEGLCELEV